MNRTKPLVGVTGGIGNGKTTVSKILEELGAAVFDADKAARKITEDVTIVEAIRASFGDSILLPSGQLDRAKLAEIVFHSVDDIRKLNDIIHPKVLDQFWKFATEQKDNPRAEMIIIDAPLIFETGLEKKLDYVVVVAVDEEIAIKRVMERSKLARDQIVKRMSYQMPLSEKIKRAHFCIDNNRGVEDLKENVKDVYQRILERWKN